MNKQLGGWYPNPKAGGKTMRWWGTDSAGNDLWTEGEDPTGGRGIDWAKQATSAIPTQPGGEDYISSLIQTLTGQVVPQALEFDTEAARRAAEEEWSPYYEEILQDYLASVTTGQERSTADLASALGLLGGRREEYLGGIERESPLLQEAIGGRFADRGLYFGGEREETQRRQLEEEERQKATYEREYEYKKTQAELEQKRYLEDVERQRKQRERELARQREAAITGQVETAREEKYYGWS